MIKGVSRQIVEIVNTGNPYFERAFLVVKPSFTDRPYEDIEREAGRVLLSQKGYTGLRRARRLRRCGQAGLLIIGGILGVLIEKAIPSLL